MIDLYNEENCIAILLYHRIGFPRFRSPVRGQYVAPRLMDMHIRYMINDGWMPVSLVDISKFYDGGRVLPKKSFVITFDDGFENLYLNALPVLKKYDIPSTIFLVADHINSVNRWNIVEGDIEERTLSIPQIQEMASYKVSFGSHTCTHPRLTWISPDAARAEIADSKAKLEDALDMDVDTIAYPYGFFNPEIEDFVRESGYKLAVATTLGVAGRDSDIFALPRINIRWTSFTYRFAAKLRKAVRVSNENT